MDKGELSDADLVAHRVPITRVRDELVVWRRREVMLTNPKLVIREQVKSDEKMAVKIAKEERRGKKRQKKVEKDEDQPYLPRSTRTRQVSLNRQVFTGR